MGSVPWWATTSVLSCPTGRGHWHYLALELEDVVLEACESTELPDLKPEDIREALRYAAEAVRERELPLLSRRS
jgi:hypothetical protein